MKKRLLALSLLFISTILFGQNENDKSYILKKTNVEKLSKISENSKKHFLKHLELFEAANKPKTILLKNNQVATLCNFDSDGNPIYLVTHNVAAAKTARVDQIWQGGSSGLNLDGSGIAIGHWEPGGVALSTHQELVGKIDNVDNAQATSHATHTAGTMVATGINAEARGMASAATIKAYDGYNNDSEIASFALNGGILSNHSYGYFSDDALVRQIYYGKYSEISSIWDRLIYNAPYLTMVKSAGNSRNDGENIQDSGYDLVASSSTSKNVLVVGAVRDMGIYFGPSSVLQSSFSSWGPTDDWRIKPDIVTNGVGVISTDMGSSTDYSSKSGTSMAAPTATGAIALLQQYFHQKNNVFMTAATVKALLIGTADEAGSHDGPDFQNGWGALNAERAAEVITENGQTSRIEELTLNQGETYETTFQVDDNANVTATLVWTDPQGNESDEVEDSNDIKLINDLDIRIYGNNEEYMPWILTPNETSNNFTDAATKGDNFRDNVERIDLKNLPEGTYVLKVTHKGLLINTKLLNSTQDFSLVIQGLSNRTLSISDDFLTNKSVIIYPNPSTDRNFNVSINNSNSGYDYKVQVYDLLGKKVKSKTYTTNNFKVDLPNATSGIYIIKIQSGPYNYQKMVHLKN
jgi:subtilisin family serine protease